jgi:hypothetical protein
VQYSSEPALCLCATEQHLRDPLCKLQNKSQSCAVSPRDLYADLDGSGTEVKLTHVSAVRSAVVSSEQGMSDENDGDKARRLAGGRTTFVSHGSAKKRQHWTHGEQPEVDDLRKQSELAERRAQPLHAFQT